MNASSTQRKNVFKSFQRKSTKHIPRTKRRRQSLSSVSVNKEISIKFEPDELDILEKAYEIIKEEVQHD